MNGKKIQVVRVNPNGTHTLIDTFADWTSAEKYIHDWPNSGLVVVQW
jgi:hypothetical protein